MDRRVQHSVYLVYVVGNLALCDCPWPLMVTLEGGYLATYKWGLTTAIVVY